MIWGKRKFGPLSPSCLTLLACLAPVSSLAQQEPVPLENVDVGSHYVRPIRMIHTADAKSLTLGSAVVLDVVVSVGGNVESAHAIGGPAKFFADAESIERNRQFQPFEQDGVAVRARIKDSVQIAPLQQWAKTRVPFPEVKDLSTLRISLIRTSCYGSCPSYSVEVRGGVEVVYRGKENGTVLITGEHHATISRKAVENLLQAFRDADYFSLQDNYSQFVTDVPTYTTSIEFDGHKKSVGDHLGSGAGMPDVVTELEDKVDELAATSKWLKETSQTWPALLAEHWNFRAETDENRTLFASVCQLGSADLIQSFLAAGSPALAINQQGASPVVNAAEKGDFDLVRRMLGSQASPPPQLLFRILRAAAHSGNVDLIEFLISKGADVNGSPDNPNDKETVLMGATTHCKKAAVQEVLRYHPQLDAQDVNGYSVLSRFFLSCPANADGDAIFELLIAAGSNVNLKNDQGRTPLFSACFNPHAVSLLANAGADLNIKDQFGKTALMHCVQSDFAKAMITAGADLYARDRAGRTAADGAREMGITDKADLLESAIKVSSKLQH